VLGVVFGSVRLVQTYQAHDSGASLAAADPGWHSLLVWSFCRTIPGVRVWLGKSICLKGLGWRLRQRLLFSKLKKHLVLAAGFLAPWIESETIPPKPHVALGHFGGPGGLAASFSRLGFRYSSVAFRSAGSCERVKPTLFFVTGKHSILSPLWCGWEGFGGCEGRFLLEVKAMNGTATYAIWGEKLRDLCYSARKTNASPRGKIRITHEAILPGRVERVWVGKKPAHPYNRRLLWHISLNSCGAEVLAVA